MTGTIDRRGFLRGSTYIPAVSAGPKVMRSLIDRTADSRPGSTLPLRRAASFRCGRAYSVSPSPLLCTRGVTIQGSGRHYEYLPDGNDFTGLGSAMRGRPQDPRCDSGQCSIGRSLDWDCCREVDEPQRLKSDQTTIQLPSLYCSKTSRFSVPAWAYDGALATLSRRLSIVTT